MYIVPFLALLIRAFCVVINCCSYSVFFYPCGSYTGQEVVDVLQANVL